MSQLTEQTKTKSQLATERRAEARREAIAKGLVTSWSIGEMATTDGFSHGHIRNAIANGELRAFKVGRRVIIPESERQHWLSRKVAILKKTAKEKADQQAQAHAA